MFEELVDIREREGTLIIYNANEERFSMLMDTCSWDRRILDDHDKIVAYIEYCGMDIKEFRIEAETIHSEFGFHFHWLEA